MRKRALAALRDRCIEYRTQPVLRNHELLAETLETFVDRAIAGQQRRDAIENRREMRGVVMRRNGVE